MLDKKKILDLIFSQLLDSSDPDVISEFKASKSKESFRLLGPQSVLDSMELVSLIVSVEAELKEFDSSINLVSDSAMSQSISPFRTPNSLADYVISQL